MSIAKFIAKSIETTTKPILLSQENVTYKKTKFESDVPMSSMTMTKLTIKPDQEFELLDNMIEWEPRVDKGF